MKYIQLVTFLGEKEGYVQRAFYTKEPVPTSKEWDEFTQSVFGPDNIKWCAINIVCVRNVDKKK